MARRHINKEQTIQRICDALKAGNLRKTSIKYAGISEETFYQWLKNPELSERIEEAEAAAEAYHVTNIRRHADKQWTASAWWLERNPRTKQQWKRLEGHEHSGPDGRPIEVRGAATSFDYRVAQALERGGADEGPGGPDG